MKIIETLVILVAACAANACNKESKAEVCDVKHADSDWMVIGEGGLKDRLAKFIASQKDLGAAKHILGKPKLEVHDGSGVSMLWASGARRVGRTYKCGKLIEQTYHISYVVPEIKFSNGKMISCKAYIKEYIGPEKDRDPILDKPLIVENMSCQNVINKED